MQRLLAIDCDPRELCLVLASAVGERITLQAVESISLVRTADEPALTNEQLGKQLQVVLARYKQTGAKILIGVDRNAVELLEFSIPPAGDAELPNLVLNHVTMESPSLAEESVIDFVTDSGASSEPRRITAAVLSKNEFARINAVCASAGIRSDRMLVRPYETASLFLKSQTLRGGNSLIVNVISDEVDLIVVDRVQPLFFRTVRLPGGLGNESAEKRLLHEIRRTLLVAPQTAADTQAIESVQILGNSLDHERIVRQLSQGSSVTVEKCDPFAGFFLGSEWESPESGRVIPLLGMLVNEVRGGKHAIDFLHPRRPAQRPNRTRQLTLGLIALALVGGAGANYLWETFTTADSEIKKLVEELSDLESLVKKTAEKKKVIEAIDDWNANTVVWLDEIRDLSSKFPSGQDLVLQRLTMSPARGGRASIAFQGLAREPNVVTRMESTLRDSRHEVQTPRVDERVQDKSYTWNFETSVSLSPAKFETGTAIDKDNHETTKKSSKKKPSPKSNPPGKTAKAKDDEARNPTDDESSTKAVPEGKGI